MAALPGYKLQEHNGIHMMSKYFEPPRSAWQVRLRLYQRMLSALDTVWSAWEARAKAETWTSY
jgi:hypothetical protein